MIDDQVVNGVLCYYKDGKWVEYSPREITARLILAKNSLEELKDRASVLANDLLQYSVNA